MSVNKVSSSTTAESEPCEDIDGFDTQIVDSDNETQPMYFSEEMDLVGETQVMDDYDFMEHMETQLLELSDNEIECNSDGEGAERTQLLCDTDGNGDQTISSGENGDHKCHQDDGRADTESLPSGNRTQCSGLLKLASEKAESGSCFSGFCSASDYGGILNVEKADVEHGKGKFGDKGLSIGNISKVARSLARELYMGEDVAEKGSHDCENNRGADLIRLAACDNEMAGLTYVDSQEPGELSQANALEFVDKFLKINVWDSDQENMSKNAVDQIVSSAAIAKGPKSMAQQANCRTALAEAAVFDWNDTQEDEGGGEFFVKNKEVLLGTTCGVRKRCSKSQIFMLDESRVSQSLGKIRNERDRQKIHDKTMSFVHSDSKLVKSSQIRQLEINSTKKVDNYKDEQVGLNSCSREVLKAASNADFTDMLTVGINTQMAAEAMEALSTGSPLVTNDCSFTIQNQKNGRKRCKRDGTRKVLSEKGFVGNRSHLSKSDTCNISKQAKQMSMKSGRECFVASRTRSRCAVEEFTVDLLKPKGNHRRPNMKSIFTENERVSSGIELVDIDEKNMLEDKMNNNGASEVRGQCLQGKLSSATKLYSKIRQQIAVNNLSDADDGYSRGQRNLDKVTAGRNNRMCRNKGDVASGISESGVEELNLTSMTENINADGSTDRGTDIQHSLKQVNRNRKNQSLLGSGSDEVVLQSIARRTRSRSSARCTEEMLSSENPSHLSSLNATSMTENINVDGSTDRGADIQHSLKQVNRNRKKQSLLGSRRNVVLQSIAGRTRSRSSAQCTEVPQEGNAQHLIKMLSSEHPSHLSSQNHEACFPLPKRAVLRVGLEEAPRAMSTSNPANVTPVNLKTSSAVSPVCVGDNYFESSCKKKLSLKTEFHKLWSHERRKFSSNFKDLRQRRDVSNIRVLFSQHLDEDVIRQQKKILSRLGVLVASSISDATHFVADAFVRTRNMLEAIASGKPVVTRMWLESCGQAGCFIDERNYILRDVKKERELGFSMPMSLAHANRWPLLEGRRVLITSNVKPGKDILSSLVKAVHGLAIERLCRTMSDNERLTDDLLVLSCDEDFEDCVPLLEKGIPIYSSELLLNGIITQKLEYERYRMFVDYVKKTRSTLWVKKDGYHFLSVRKRKNIAL